MLEERLKEAEQRCKSLQEQNAALRRHAAAAQQQNQLTLASSTVEGGTQTDDRHPAFGRLVADLGFKKIFVASARTFVSSVPIWSKQRPCNEGRVEDIVKAKAASPHFQGARSRRDRAEIAPRLRRDCAEIGEHCAHSHDQA